MLFLRRPRKPLACFRTRLRRRCEGTARGARDMVEPPLCRVGHPAADALGFGRRHDLRSPKLADLLVGSLDHAVALAGLAVLELAVGSEFEALLRARLCLQLGHFAVSWDGWPGPPDLIRGQPW